VGGLRAVLASRNAQKARELELLLPGWTIEPLEADGWPDETGETYVENARAKAQFGRAFAGADRWTIGEDSGIEVHALAGRPGLHSARYAPEGAPAIAKLLGELEGVSDRRARYVSELVALAPDGREVRGSGVLEGRIAGAPSGGKASATTRCSSPTARSAPSPSSATDGRTSTRIARAPRRRYAMLSSGSALTGDRRSPIHQLSSAPNTITFAMT
jgi:XTP/dITP diphosphohydrolase